MRSVTISRHLGSQSRSFDRFFPRRRGQFGTKSFLNKELVESSQISCPPPNLRCYHQPGVPMKHMSVVVQQLKREREQVQKQLQRIAAALAALGSSSNGSSRTMSAAGRRRISLAQKARWAKAKGPRRSRRERSQLRGGGELRRLKRARWAKLKRAA